MVNPCFYFESWACWHGMQSVGMLYNPRQPAPAGADKLLRAVFVTPDMHRVHHSSLQQGTDSNFARPGMPRSDKVMKLRRIA
jgi:sterol desaturase/sphingolipid hydroxylase (fatty acid hydroxylase superfamily)